MEQPPTLLEDQLSPVMSKVPLKSTLSLTLRKLSRDKVEFNTFHSKKKLLNTETNLESKEFPKKEKLSNIKKKLESKVFQEKSPLPITMLSNIFVNIFHNISQKNKSITLLEKEKLKSMNTFQLKDKSFTTQNNLLKPN